MKHLGKSTAVALVLALAVPRAAQAHDETGLVLFDIFLNLFAVGVQVAALEQATHSPPPDALPQIGRAHV